MQAVIELAITTATASEINFVGAEELKIINETLGSDILHAPDSIDTTRDETSSSSPVRSLVIYAVR